MTKTTSWTVAALALSALVAMPAIAGNYAKAEMPSKDIVETATAAGSFETLLAAATAAGLVDTLKSDGPFTVFAPTDEAFAALPAGTVEGLLADPAELKRVLLYHVVPGKVTAKEVVKLDSAKSALGQSLTIATKGGVTVDGVNVVKTDILTSNGVIHVIDGVLMPKSDS